MPLSSSLRTEDLAASAVRVDVDWTFVLQVAIFVVLFFLLKEILFKPMLKLFEEREKGIDGAKNEAREMYKQADEKMAKYEEELVGVKREAGIERDKLRAEGQRQEQQILAQVRTETNAMLDEGRAKIAQDGAALKKELEVASQALAKEIASRVLGREVS